MKDLYDSLGSSFRLSSYYQKRPDLAFCAVEASQLVSLLTHLRDIRGFGHLVLVTCVDFLEEDRLRITYLLHNYSQKQDFGIWVYLPRSKPTMSSIDHLWKHARVYQRELFEMFGIDFPGSPDVHKPMILEGWEGPPVMLRDFDTKEYCEEHYSNRPRHDTEPERHMKEKLYPED